MLNHNTALYVVNVFLPSVKLYTVFCFLRFWYEISFWNFDLVKFVIFFLEDYCFFLLSILFEKALLIPKSTKHSPMLLSYTFKCIFNYWVFIPS